MSRLNELFDAMYQRDPNDQSVDREVAVVVIKHLILDLIGDDEGTAANPIISGHRNRLRAELRKKVEEL